MDCLIWILHLRACHLVVYLLKLSGVGNEAIRGGRERGIVSCSMRI